ncbi:hypothetical protein VP01_480g5 [Puccinia sorghi]|uniref:Uncharacterized protein n=1 Tax=Puccinia sorghi TaxID=27349 RepID=A0A0L6UMK6_9BASI|nr:hypothetical protein VP01_480g5 [Puccinia sorghi]
MQGEVVDITDNSEDLRTIQGESDSRTGGDTPSEMIAGRPNDATANALTKSDREFLSKYAMEADLKATLRYSPGSYDPCSWKNRSVKSHLDLGFSKFFKKNIRGLKGPLPLTTFDRRWQLEATQTCHVHKWPRLKQMHHGVWERNYRSFHATLRDVYGLFDFASRLLQYEERFNELCRTYGFLPAFRKDLWDRSYNLSQKLDELRFEDNPYRKGGASIRQQVAPLQHD